MRLTTFILMLALLPLGVGTAAAQDQHPNPKALLEQWLESNQQENIEAALRSAKQHAVAGEKDAAIADYRKVLALAPNHPDAVAGLKSLGLSDASIAAPPPKFGPPGGSPDAGGNRSQSAPTGGGGGGGGPLGDGLF